MEKRLEKNDVLIEFWQKRVGDLLPWDLGTHGNDEW